MIVEKKEIRILMKNQNPNFVIQETFRKKVSKNFFAEKRFTRTLVFQIKESSITIIYYVFILFILIFYFHQHNPLII